MDNPLRAALKTFDAAVRGAFDIIAAFWRPLHAVVTSSICFQSVIVFP
jgi:hypothetical protein